MGDTCPSRLVLRIAGAGLWSGLVKPVDDQQGVQGRGVAVSINIHGINGMKSTLLCEIAFALASAVRTYPKTPANSFRIGY